MHNLRFVETLFREHQACYEGSPHSEKSVVCLFYKAMFITSIVFKMSNMMLKQVNKRNLIKVNN